MTRLGGMRAKLGRRPVPSVANPKVQGTAVDPGLRGGSWGDLVGVTRPVVD